MLLPARRSHAEDLEAEAKVVTDKERLIGLFAAPLAAGIALVVTDSLIANDPAATLANGQPNRLHVERQHLSRGSGRDVGALGDRARRVVVPQASPDRHRPRFVRVGDLQLALLGIRGAVHHRWRVVPRPRLPAPPTPAGGEWRLTLAARARRRWIRQLLRAETDRE